MVSFLCAGEWRNPDKFSFLLALVLFSTCAGRGGSMALLPQDHELCGLRSGCGYSTRAGGGGDSIGPRVPGAGLPPSRSLGAPGVSLPGATPSQLLLGLVFLILNTQLPDKPSPEGGNPIVGWACIGIKISTCPEVYFWAYLQRNWNIQCSMKTLASLRV